MTFTFKIMQFHLTLDLSSEPKVAYIFFHLPFFIVLEFSHLFSILQRHFSVHYLLSFSNMSKLIQLITKKPTDKTIRLVRVGFALVLLFVITFGIQKTHWNYATIPAELIYILYLFPCIGLVRGILDPGIFRKKIWKWTIFGLGMSMMTISFFLIETDSIEPHQKITVETNSGVISADQFSV